MEKINAGITEDEALVLPFDKKVILADKIIKIAFECLENPIVNFSGGKHSCFMLHLVLRVRQNVKVVFINNGFELPEVVDFVKTQAKKLDLNYDEATITLSPKEYIMKYGMSLYDDVPLKKKDYCKFKIGKGCKYRLKIEPMLRYMKMVNSESKFLGIMGAETPFRKMSFRKRGFIYKDSDNLWKIKPIAHFNAEEVNAYIKEKNIQYPIDFYRKFPQTTCYCCGWGMLKKVKDLEMGLPQSLAVHWPEIWKAMLSWGVREELLKIASYTGDIKLWEFIRKYVY